MTRVRRLAVLGALAVLPAGCAQEPIAPLPVQAAPSPSVTVSAPASVPVIRTPAGAPVVPRRTATTTPPRPDTVRTTTPTTTQPPPPAPSPSPSVTCLGAVRYDIDLRTTVLDLVRSLCFGVGGVLRLQGIGPGLVTAEPEELVSQNYEAAVVDVRFVRPGTVTVTVPQENGPHTITVVVTD